MNYVGIDWADEKHDVCVVSPDGRLVSEFSIDHDGEGFEQLKAILSQLGEVEINIERPNGLLVDWLVGQGWPVFVTPPQVVSRRRPRPSKDDRGDAYLLANLRRWQDEDCRRLPLQSEQVEALCQVVQGFDQLQRERQRLSSQLRDVLKAYYPVATRVFSKLHQPLTLAFLQAFPTPQAAQAASRQELVTFFQQQRYRWMQRVDTIYEQLQAPAPRARLQQGYVYHMLALVPSPLLACWPGSVTTGTAFPPIMSSRPWRVPCPSPVPVASRKRSRSALIVPAPCAGLLWTWPATVSASPAGLEATSTANALVVMVNHAPTAPWPTVGCVSSGPSGNAVNHMTRPNMSPIAPGRGAQPLPPLIQFSLRSLTS